MNTNNTIFDNLPKHFNKYLNITIIILILILFLYVIRKNKVTSNSEVVSKLCRQSPINITPSNIIIKNKEILKIDYLGQKIKATRSEREDNNVNYMVEGEHYTTFNGSKFKLIQYHFHMPSEHTINKKKYTMEVHFVHKANDKDKYLVIGLFIKDGNRGPFDSSIALKDKVTLQINNNPKMTNYYFYPGSLTKDPFNSNVSWILFENPIESRVTSIWDKSLGHARKQLDNISHSEVLKFSAV